MILIFLGFEWVDWIGRLAFVVKVTKFYILYFIFYIYIYILYLYLGVLVEINKNNKSRLKNGRKRSKKEEKKEAKKKKRFTLSKEMPVEETLGLEPKKQFKKCAIKAVIAC